MTDTVEQLGSDEVLQEARELLRFYQSSDPSKPYTCSVIADCISMIEALRAASEWRDISTAPRDTKAFLVWVPENQCTFQVSRTDRGLCIFGGDHRDYLDRATHWMPLPAPPQRNEVKK